MYGGEYSVDFEFDITTVITVGHLIKEDDKKIIIARELFIKENEGEIRGIIVIPKKNIIEMEILE